MTPLRISGHVHLCGNNLKTGSSRSRDSEQVMVQQVLPPAGPQMLLQLGWKRQQWPGLISQEQRCPSERFKMTPHPSALLTKFVCPILHVFLQSFCAGSYTVKSQLERDDMCCHNVVGSDFVKPHLH
ncbi:hypothetical protein GJAV_G00206040 [Gymnothorax javanicus]|nr:hypothetical protein GJAV_G00206040 [Gymnothorax javanicus]